MCVTQLNVSVLIQLPNCFSGVLMSEPALRSTLVSFHSVSPSCRQKHSPDHPMCINMQLKIGPTSSNFLLSESCLVNMTEPRFETVSLEVLCLMGSRRTATDRPHLHAPDCWDQSFRFVSRKRHQVTSVSYFYYDNEEESSTRRKARLWKDPCGTLWGCVCVGRGLHVSLTFVFKGGSLTYPDEHGELEQSRHWIHPDKREGKSSCRSTRMTQPATSQPDHKQLQGVCALTNTEVTSPELSAATESSGEIVFDIDLKRIKWPVTSCSHIWESFISGVFGRPMENQPPELMTE